MWIVIQHSRISRKLYCLLLISHVNTWAKQTCSSRISYSSPSASAKGRQSFRNDIFDGGRLLDFQIKTKFRLLGKAKAKQNTLDLIHVSYTYLYIFHVQSYIPNPRDSIIEINTEITTLLNEIFAHRNEASASNRQQEPFFRLQRQVKFWIKCLGQKTNSEHKMVKLYSNIEKHDINNKNLIF